MNIDGITIFNNNFIGNNLYVFKPKNLAIIERKTNTLPTLQIIEMIVIT